MAVNSAAIGKSHRAWRQRCTGAGGGPAAGPTAARTGMLRGAPPGGAPAGGGAQGAGSSAAPGAASAPGSQADGESGEGQGALAKIGTAIGVLTSAEQSLSTLLSGIPMPAFPAARITDWAFGIPHAHSHPPNLIPPAPPIPLPATGPIIKIPYVSGADTVLINNLPAARCGDMGVNIWCGGYFPFYEIFLGSSSVWIEGARAARLGVDMTKHCVFSTPKPNDLPLGPMIGAIVQGSPNVIIGGVPLPSLTNIAIGLAFKAVFKGIGRLVKAARAAKAAAAARRAALQKLGGMIGDGHIATKPLSLGSIARLNRAIENRMRALGIPTKRIGIPEYGGKAFNPLGDTVGGNIKGRGINIDAAILQPIEGWPAWNKASLSTRVDAVIAHEWTEYLSKAKDPHQAALRNAPKTKLKISDKARALLEAKRE